MSKRRTAEEVFNMPDPVKQFVDHGVLTDAGPPAAQTASGGSDASALKVIQLDEERSASPNMFSARRLDHQAPEQQARSIDLSRTYAKATVQKTIRFLPRFIAELELYTRNKELAGEKPIPFQQVQNEALDLWLERHVRRVK